jgi:phosphoesterase RecJ-like protein
MSSLTRSETARWLRDHDNFLILTHRRPDGDTIGSAALLCRGLRALGKNAHVLRNMEITEKYRHLHAGLNQDCPESGDTIISVDVAAPQLLPEVFSHLSRRVRLRIDHHSTDTPFAPLELVDAGAGACAELIYDVLQELGVALDKPMAEALYTAISTDTGCFRYANTTAHTFLTAAACAAAGGDLHGINQRIFETNSFAKLRLHSWMVENIRFLQDGKLAICALPLEVEKQLALTEDDLENVSGFPLSIEGVCVAATLRQNSDGKVKLSVRALPGYSAAALCEKFGGGGHKGAAGATLSVPLEEAAAMVAVEMEKLFSL